MAKQDWSKAAFKSAFIKVSIFFGAVIALAIWLVPSEEEIARQDAERAADPTSGATYACRENIKAALLSPSSADWGHWSGWPTEMEEGGVVRVAASLEASNAYGTQIRQDFICRVRKADGVWNLVDLAER